MNESMIESCSSPDYTQQEMELGKDFFFDMPETTPPSQGNPPLALSVPAMQFQLAQPTVIMTPQQLTISIEKLRQNLKETGHIIVLQDPNLKNRRKPKTKRVVESGCIVLNDIGETN